MEWPNYIAKIAKMFHISPSALRYWDKEGLIRFQRCEENNYRTPSLQTIMDIGDVLLFRSLSVPIKDIRQVPQMNNKQLHELLEKNEQALYQQMEQLQHTLEKTKDRKAMIARVETLRQQALFVESCQLSAIRPFSFENTEDVQIYVHDSYRTVLLLDPDFSIMPASGIITQDTQEVLLRRQDDVPRAYLRGLLQVDANDFRRHNGDTFHQKAQSLGYVPGPIVARYLSSACEKKRYDYYEAWMQLDSPKKPLHPA